MASAICNKCGGVLYLITPDSCSCTAKLLLRLKEELAAEKAKNLQTAEGWAIDLENLRAAEKVVQAARVVSEIIKAGARLGSTGSLNTALAEYDKSRKEPDGEKETEG